jgi:hypothetical protein
MMLTRLLLTVRLKMSSKFVSFNYRSNCQTVGIPAT